MKTSTKIEAGAWALLLTVNPLVIPHVNQGINWFVDNVVMANSGYVMFAAAGAIGITRLVSYRKANTVHVPKKTAKTQKAGRFIQDPVEA